MTSTDQMCGNGGLIHVWAFPRKWRKEMYEEKKTKAADLNVTAQAVATEDTIRK